MFEYYTPVLILQGFCLFHAYRQQTAQKWFFIIIFIPLVGSLIYLYENFYTRSAVNTISEGIKEVVISNYRISQLEKQLKFSDNIKNKIMLADAYVQNKRYTEAIGLYQDCRQGYMAEDPFIAMKLLNTSFLNGDYDECLVLGRMLDTHKEFRNSEERTSFAWALHAKGFADEAENIFKDMDRSYSNFRQRYSYCLYLIRVGRQADAEAKVAELKEEINHMKGTERRIHQAVIADIRNLRVK